MKRLTSKQVEEIVRRVNHTREHEFNCSECLQHVSELVERQMAGKPLGDVLDRAEHHLGICPECREEYEALLKILHSVE